LDPSPGQRIALARAFGCARVVFNDALRIRQEARAAGLDYVRDGDLAKRVTTDAKRTPERAWLAEVSSVVLQQAVADLNTAYRNFFNSVTGKRRGRKVAPPRFRSRKDNRQAIRFTANARFKVLDNGRLRLPKVGDVRVVWSRDLPAEPSSVAVIRDAAGRYFASFVVEVSDPDRVPATAEVGIDLGLMSFAVRSDGEIIDNPRFLRKAERRLRRAQQALSRKQKGSANRKKAVRKVARIHAVVRDTRRDWLHKASTAIVRENQAIFVEDLAVAGLARTRLAKSVHDAGWSTFVGMLEYKACRYGRTFGKVDRWAPTSQMCSACGDRGSKKPLKVREWTCTTCGTRHDRDVNAASNILALGLRDKKNACGAPVSLAAMPARCVEAGTPSKLPRTVA
jgi:putative transposase